MCVPSAAGFLLLTVAFVACGVGFIAPQWVFFPADVLEKSFLDEMKLNIQKMFNEGGQVAHEGLLGRCFAPDNKCFWFWHDDFAMEKDIKGQYFKSDLKGLVYAIGVWHIVDILCVHQVLI